MKQVDKGMSSRTQYFIIVVGQLSPSAKRSVCLAGNPSKSHVQKDSNLITDVKYKNPLFLFHCCMKKNYLLVFSVVSFLKNIQSKGQVTKQYPPPN